MGFTLLRVPFFLEPDYPTDPAFEETNRTRLLRKWGGKEGWDAQKARHTLKERGREVGIEHFNLDRIASNTLASHRMVQWVTRTLGINAAESMYADLNMRHFEAGQKLNDVDMLVKAAEKVGAQLCLMCVACAPQPQGNPATGRSLPQVLTQELPAHLSNPMRVKMRSRRPSGGLLVLVSVVFRRLSSVANGSSHQELLVPALSSRFSAKSSRREGPRALLYLPAILTFLLM